MISLWKKEIAILHKTLQELSVKDVNGKEIDTDESLLCWKKKTEDIRNSENSIFLVGNGASASIASHFATDISKNANIRANVFSDSALLTALSNDISYEEVFSEALRMHMKKNDMLIAISSSGNSPNIVNAVKKALSLGGEVITLSGMDQNNAIRGMGNLNFYVSAQTYGLIETAHAAILHYWMDRIEKS